MNRHLRAIAARRLGFTLVELGVVLSIVGLLIALLLPAVATARQSAQVAACASNLRQVGVALAVYTGDSADRYPNPWSMEKPASAGGVPGGIPGEIVQCRRRHAGVWPVLLNAYSPAPIGTWAVRGQRIVGQAPGNRNNIYTCPQPRPGWSEFGQGVSTRGAGNYTMNPVLYQFEVVNAGTWIGSHLYSMGWQWSYEAGLRRVGRAVFPARTIAVAEGYVGGSVGTGAASTALAQPPIWADPAAGDGRNNIHPAPLGRGSARWPYHLGLANNVFLDGHVAALDSEQVGTLAGRRELWSMTRGSE